MAQARAEAVATVEQRMQTEAETRHADAVAQHQPTAAFPASVTVETNGGGLAKIIGVYDILDGGKQTVYMTENGKLVTGDRLTSSGVIPRNRVKNMLEPSCPLW